ncbi:hypothetical protein LTR50_003476 [Elasticomyces elasticus]|nr:hypothetical protein LTR50_003476 [Elasticomyces elasticus]
MSCDLLHELLPAHVSFPNDTTYATEQLYWSQQQQQTYPKCRFTPVEAHEISAALLLIKATSCQFAVKSGGHASYAGGSNIQDGLTIDLSDLNTLKVASNGATVQVGAGNRWEDVYTYLDPLGLAVIGGRNADIGVGGLTLGGGISFFSNYYGWALDNVQNYEVIQSTSILLNCHWANAGRQVVLANGTIVDANVQSHPDLYFALRGGSNNFGIVTCFALEAFPHGLMWGGTVVYAASAAEALFNAFYWFNEKADNDPNAHMWVASAIVPGQGLVFSVSLDYALPHAAPPVFDNFTSIPSILSTTRITTLLNLTKEIKSFQPPGAREIFITATFKNDKQLMSDIYDIWHEAAESAHKRVPSLQPSITFQAVTANVIRRFARNGGNALGIKPEDGNVMLMVLAWSWAANDTEADVDVIDTVQKIVADSVVLATSRGLNHRYIYQNYAYISQPVFDSYGPENKARLLEIQEKYDPDKVFVDLQPGYFKLRP